MPAVSHLHGFNAMRPVPPGILKVWIDPSIRAALRQDIGGAAATIPAAPDQPVGSVLNLGAQGGWYAAPSDAARPTLRTDGGRWWLEWHAAARLARADASLLRGVSGWSLLAAIQPLAGANLAIQEVSASATAARAALWYASGAGVVPLRISSRRTNAEAAHTLSQTGSVTSGADAAIIATADLAARTRTLFVNGVQNAQATAVSTAGQTPADFGAHTLGNNTPGNGAFAGRIYGLGVAETALSASQIPALTRALRARMGLRG